ncbi:MAG: sulfate adenylyltransferase, partial [Chloroflexi bacterium]|nr:sulfate adenylyltransferase [Chloroflexota bacterium]
MDSILSSTIAIPPHGGTLVDRVLSADARDEAIARAAGLPQIVLAPVNLADLEIIASGIASPLTGFMCREDY